MQYIALTAASFATFLSMVNALQTGGFSLLAIRSGSPLQYAAAEVGPDNAIVLQSSSKTPFRGFMLADGRVRVGGTDQWLTVGADQTLQIGTGSPVAWADDGEGHLGTSGFTAVQGNDGFKVYSGNKKVDGTSYNIVFRIVYDEESTSTSGGSSSSSSSSSAHPSITSAATQTSAASTGVVTKTVTDCVEHGTCHGNTTLPQVNGAAAIAQGFVGAAAAAFAGALLL